MTQTHKLARDLAGLTGPLVLAGDLNAPPASPVLAALEAVGLRNAFSLAGRGYGYSYGHSMRWGYDFLRIDHIYVSRDIDVIDSFGTLLRKLVIHVVLLLFVYCVSLFASLL